ncbi:hypothetical protein KC19_11G091900 [Ceratodon purpureus]|uniref:X8 domain-containing protein n=1 Tax=Ceratodon purpureus TaxID=3225 RepID=A0A8T0GCM2_CERPU|nr:hypothetical protein KC19_11G091900 [Ceratodon purpureus]
MTRIAMVNQFFGVLALFVVLVSLLGTVAGEREASPNLELYDDVPMINLNEELEMYYNWSRPRERRLDTTTFVWCIAKSNISDTALQSSLDWACGTNPNQGQVNCGPINVGGACYDPNTLQHHCDWAFNAYFQRMNATSSACDFQGVAQQVTTDPSSTSCIFPGSNLTVITNGTLPPSNSPGAAPGPNIFGTGSAANLAVEPQFILRLSTAVILFTYLFT